MKAGEEAGRHNLKKPAPTLNPKPNPGSESVNEPMMMNAGEEAGRHNLKKPAPMIDPMSWAEMNARNSSTRAQGSAPNCVRGGVPFGVPNPKP